LSSPRSTASTPPRQQQTVTRAPASSPFKPAAKVDPKIKALVFGAPGVGKTHLALTCPGRVAAIDTEGGTAFFTGRVPEFDVIGTKSYSDVVAAIDWIAKHPDAYATVVIDPITVIYDTLQDAAIAARTAKIVAQGGDAADVDIEQREWGRIKRLYKALMTRLVNLPCHVIVVAREKDEMVRRGAEMEKIGVKADSEKGTAYWFDVMVRLSTEGGHRVATIAKDRTGTHAVGAKITDPTFDALFGKIVAGVAGEPAPTAQRHVEDDAVAANADAESFGTKLATPEQAAECAAALVAAGYDPDEVREHRNWPPFVELPEAKVVEMTAWATSKAKAVDEAPASDAATPDGAEVAA
jgi:hypothetical protein